MAYLEESTSNQRYALSLPKFPQQKTISIHQHTITVINNTHNEILQQTYIYFLTFPDLKKFPLS